MNNKVHLGFGSAAAARPRPLGVLILYDNAASGAHAVSAFRRWARALDQSYSPAPSLCRIDLLNSAGHGDLALSEAAQANAVFVAWSCSATALSSQRAWTDQWPTLVSTLPRSLLWLFTGSATGAEQAALRAEIDFLRDLAQRTGMELIASSLDDVVVSATAPARHVLPRWRDARRL